MEHPIATLDKDKLLMKKIDDTISGHFQDSDFDFYALSTFTDISTSKLYSVIKKERNDTPGKYILKRRLDEAIKLLTTSTICLKQVTYLTGFNDDSYFTLSFKGRFGKTPDEVMEIKACSSK